METVTIYYLEMTSPSALSCKEESKDLLVCECEIKQFQYNKFLYQFVGEPWQWTDKLAWTDEEWRSYVDNDKLRTWVAYHKGCPAGYYELQQQEGGDVEIVYFGLALSFIGRGFGGYLLARAIRSAWELAGTRRVWVHTCSLDHPGALANYQARGMSLYHVENEAK